MLDGREKESKGGIFTPLILNHLNIPPSQKNWTPLKLMKRYDMIRHGFPGRWGPRGTTTQEEKRPEAGRIMRLLHPCSQEPAKPWFQRRKREGKTDFRYRLEVRLPTLFWMFTVCRALCKIKSFNVYYQHNRFYLPAPPRFYKWRN